MAAPLRMPFAGALAFALVAFWLAAPPAAASSGRGAASAILLITRAEAGDARAAARLGTLYARGVGVPQDQVESVRWFRFAAERGLPAAQYGLGLAYDKGLGVGRDPVVAAMWLTLAVAHASPRERFYWTRIRDAVVSKLARPELSRAQIMAAAWEAVHRP